MLSGKTVILGVSGSIAAYKAAALASLLKKQHAAVHVIMTKNACEFVNPITFESLSGNKCLVDTFDRNFEFKVEHVALAKKADVIIVAPASANAIGKFAAGIADDMLSTTMLACQCKKILAPAMNTRMYENMIVQDNLNKLRGYGFEVAEPAVGYLACGDTGAGKMLEPELLLQYVQRAIAKEKDLEGRKVLVTAGATKEAIDPVRYITNHSTGKMGYAIARMAMLRGASVTLITGETALTPPPFVKMINVVSARDMFEAVREELPKQDIIIKSAAVADYTPAVVAEQKMKKSDSDMFLELVRTNDILRYVGENRTPRQFICGFSMETENLVENSRAKLEAKQIDMIAANSLNTAGAGFGTDTNVVTVITKDDMINFPMMDKEEVADKLIDMILQKWGTVQQERLL